MRLDASSNVDGWFTLWKCYPWLEHGHARKIRFPLSAPTNLHAISIDLKHLALARLKVKLGQGLGQRIIHRKSPLPFFIPKSAAYRSHFTCRRRLLEGRHSLFGRHAFYGPALVVTCGSEPVSAGFCHFMVASQIRAGPSGARPQTVQTARIVPALSAVMLD
jgi:hypothetical protein